MAQVDDLSITVTKQTIERRALDAIRYLGCRFNNDNNLAGAADEFERRWPTSPSLNFVRGHKTKAVVPAASIDGWGGALAHDLPPPNANAFVQVSLAYEAVARLGLQRVPFLLPVPIELAPAGPGSWVAPGMSKIVVAGSLDSTNLPVYVWAELMAFSEELLRFSRPGADVLLRDRAARRMATGVDAAFFDPALAGVPGQNPASITYNAPTITAGGSGDGATEAIADLQALVDLFKQQGGRLENALFALSTTQAVALNLTGNVAFSKLRRDGGELGGLPVVASDSVGDQIVLLDAQRVLLADDGQGDIELAREAAIELSDTPTNSSATGAATNMVSLWQCNSVALRLKRVISWEALAGSVVRIENANYGGVSAGSPA